MADELIVKFWGVRGSHPAPGEHTLKYGGNTACVEVRAGARTLILDAGTGIIPLGRDLARRARATAAQLEAMLLLSHFHHDHIQGFPFFLPAFLPQARLHLFGPGAASETLERVLDGNQSPLTFPVSLREMGSTKSFCSVRAAEAIRWDDAGVRRAAKSPEDAEDAVTIRIHHSHAHPGGTYAYRIDWRGRSVVYASDTEGYVGTDRGLVQFARETDLLIHDAQYTEEHYMGRLAGYPSTQGYGHSTIEMACEVARDADVHRLALFHHDPAYDDRVLADNEAHARALFPAALMAYEGLEIAIPIQATVPMGRDVKYAAHGQC